MRVTTHSKDVDLSQIYGDTYVEDRDGRISVEPAGNYAVEAKNSKGDVEVTLPPNASASVNARTHNGDIVSDYPMPSTEGENKSASLPDRLRQRADRAERRQRRRAHQEGDGGISGRASSARGMPRRAPPANPRCRI